jgi:D-sedoheptulose 7-phosphate isomerase
MSGAGRASVERDLRAHVGAIETMVATSSSTIERIADALTRCFDTGHKALVCGNGGSAADAQHFAAEFVNQMHVDRGPWPMVALTTDTSVLTSIANDRSFETVYSRQVQALGQVGDTLVGLSTSGRSETVLQALHAGRRAGMTTIGFTGEGGVDVMSGLCDLLLVVPSLETPRIQEAHEFAYHVIARLVEETLVGRAPDHQGGRAEQ